MYDDIKKPITIGLPLSTIAALKKVAQEQDRSMSWCITKAVQEYLSKIQAEIQVVKGNYTA